MAKYNDYSTLSSRYVEEIAYSRSVEQARKAYGLPASLPENATLSAAQAELIAGTALVVIPNGAMGNNVADDTVPIQTPMTALVQYGPPLHIPAPSVLYKITASLKLPGHTPGLVVRGEGHYSTKIDQQTVGQNGLDTNSDWTGTGANGITLKDFWLSYSAGVASAGGYGIKASALLRSHIENVRMTGFLAGIYENDVLCLTVKGSAFYGNQDAMVAGPNVNSALNQFVFAYNLVEVQSRYGLNLGTGANWLIQGNLFTANLKGAITMVAGNSLSVVDNYFESNYDGTGASFDVQVATASALYGGRIVGNYHASTAADTTHYPLRIDHVNGLIVDAETVGIGTRFIRFGSYDVVNSRFGRLSLNNGGVPGLAPDRSQGAQATYANIHPLFIQQGNIMEDYVTFPCDGENYIVGDFPYGPNYSTGGSGTATFTRSPNTGTTPDSHQGHPVLLINQTVGTSAIVSETVTISATANNRMRGFWVVFLIDLLVQNSTALLFELTIAVTVGTTRNYQSAAKQSDGWVTRSICAYIDPAETTISCQFTADQVGLYAVANPRLYVGMDPRTMPGNTGAPYWSAIAAPTTGTWAVGDRVDQKTPVVGNPKGWRCTVAGTPGTWVSEGNL